MLTPLSAVHSKKWCPIYFRKNCFRDTDLQNQTVYFTKTFLKHVFLKIVIGKHTRKKFGRYIS